MEYDASDYLTALPLISSRPSTASKDSTYSRTSNSPTESSVSTKGSLNRGLWTFRSRSPTVNYRSASSSVYEASHNGSSDSLKENMRPRATTPGFDDFVKKPVPPPQKSLFSSNIPLLRRARSNLGRSSPNHSAPQATKWDDFMGEPTNASTGKTAQVKPSKFTDPFGSFPNNPRYGVEVSISGGPEKPKKATLAERAAKFGGFGKEPLSEVRPSWKGGNGRNVMVDPVRDTTQTRPRDIYTAVKKNPKEMSRTGYASHNGSDQSLDDMSKTGCLGVRFPMESSSTTSVNTIAPLPPLKVIKARPRTPEFLGTTVPARKPVPKSATGNAQPLPIASTENSRPMEIKAEPEELYLGVSTDSGDSISNMVNREMAEPRSHFSWSTYAETINEEDSDQGGQTPTGEVPYGDVDPTSHFSWTTTTSNMTYQQDSPLSSGPPTPEQAPSIMTRGRPIGSLSAQSTRTSSTVSTVARRPVGSKSGDSTPTSAVHKALPLPPTLDKEASRIEALQVRSDELDARHLNIMKVMAELEKVEHASPLEVTEKMRRENRKRLERVRTALEEAQLEKHEVGKALARARSKAQQEEGKSSSLWLRRVTG